MRTIREQLPVEKEQPERCGFYTFVAKGSCAQSGIDREVQCTIYQTQVGQEHASALKTSKSNTAREAAEI